MLPLRNSNLARFNAVAINYSTLSGSTIQVNSTMISIGASTNAAYTTLTQGNYASSISTNSWTIPLSTLVSTKTVSMSANAQTQLVVTQASTATSVQYTSTLGASWTTLSGATGLPSGTTTNYSAGAVSGDGQYGLLAASGGYVYRTQNAGQTWTNTNPNPVTPFIYLPFETVPIVGSYDAIGNSQLTTVFGSPQLTTGRVGSNALNLVNTTGAVQALQYIRGSFAGASSFSVSFWFNPQTLNGQEQVLFSVYGTSIQLTIT